jgi:hypothetical protein
MAHDNQYLQYPRFYAITVYAQFDHSLVHLIFHSDGRLLVGLVTHPWRLRLLGVRGRHLTDGGRCRRTVCALTPPESRQKVAGSSFTLGCMMGPSTSMQANKTDKFLSMKCDICSVPIPSLNTPVSSQRRSGTPFTAHGSEFSCPCPTPAMNGGAALATVDCSERHTSTAGCRTRTGATSWGWEGAVSEGSSCPPPSDSARSGVLGPGPVCEKGREEGSSSAGERRAAAIAHLNVRGGPRLGHLWGRVCPGFLHEE